MGRMAILRDASLRDAPQDEASRRIAEFIIGPRFARTCWRCSSEPVNALPTSSWGAAPLGAASRRIAANSCAFGHPSRRAWRTRSSGW